MTTYTREMLSNEALVILLVVGAGQSADPDDMALVDSKIDALLAELSARDVVYVADPDNIEAELFSALAELLANECAPSFGKPKSPAMKEDAEDRLRVITRTGRLSDLKLSVDIGLRGSPGLSLARWTRGG